MTATHNSSNPADAERSPARTLVSIGLRELEQLLLSEDFSDAPAHGLDATRFLRATLEQAARLVPSDAGSILLACSGRSEGGGPARGDDAADPTDPPTGRDRRDHLRFVVAFGESSKALVGRDIPIDHGVAGRVYASGQPYLCKRTDEDEFFDSAVDGDTGETTRSLIAAPMRVGDNVWGVVELLAHGDRTYEPLHLHILATLASQAGLLAYTARVAGLQRQLANRDHLTGLFNDRFLHLDAVNVVRAARDDGRDAAALFLDLDRFKGYVDTFGHLAGSRIIAEVGAFLRDEMTWPSARLFRYGGDEYVALLPGASEEEGRECAQHLLKQLRTRSFLVPPEFGLKRSIEPASFTFSAGVASLHHHRGDSKALGAIKNGWLRAADSAMYVAKSRGKDQVRLAGEWSV